MSVSTQHHMVFSPKLILGWLSTICTELGSSDISVEQPGGKYGDIVKSDFVRC